MRPQIEELINSVFEGMHLPLEEEVFAAQLNLYYNKAKEGGLAPYVEEVGDKNNGNFSEFVTNAFEGSIFTDKAKLEKFLDEPKISLVNDDELFKLSTDLLNRYRQ